MLTIIRRDLTRSPITMGALYWCTVSRLCISAGLPGGLTGLACAFIVGLPLYVWLFHMGKEEVQPA